MPGASRSRASEAARCGASPLSSTQSAERGEAEKRGAAAARRSRAARGAGVSVAATEAAARTAQHASPPRRAAPAMRRRSRRTTRTVGRLGACHRQYPTRALRTVQAGEQTRARGLGAIFPPAGEQLGPAAARASAAGAAGRRRWPPTTLRTATLPTRRTADGGLKSGGRVPCARVRHLGQQQAASPQASRPDPTPEQRQLPMNTRSARRRVAPSASRSRRRGCAAAGTRDRCAARRPPGRSRDERNQAQRVADLGCRRAPVTGQPGFGAHVEPGRRRAPRASRPHGVRLAAASR